MENLKSTYIGFLSLFIGAALLGASAIFVRFSETSPTVTAFYRAFLALPFLYYWLLTTNKNRGSVMIEKKHFPIPTYCI